MVVPKRLTLKKRRFTPQFKARIVKRCEQPGAVVPQIAHDHDLGSNLVKRWVREHHVRGLSKGFVPVEVVAPAAPIRDIELSALAGSNGSWWLGPRHRPKSAHSGCVSGWRD